MRKLLDFLNCSIPKLIHWLLYAGIDGIKVKVFSTSMDTKGREELLGMCSCQSYQGCPTCTHSWTAGRIFGQKACVCDGYRRFLAENSKAREKSFEFEGHTYEYRFVDNCTFGSLMRAQTHTHSHLQWKRNTWGATQKGWQLCTSGCRFRIQVTTICGS